MENTGTITKKCTETDKKFSCNINDLSDVNAPAPGSDTGQNPDPGTGTVPPRIAILLAVYEPRLDWLAEQLRSLDRQTILDAAPAVPVKLYVRDDASRRVSAEAIRACLEENVTRMPFEFHINEENAGSAAVFEQLTLESAGDWFAYCDQDDIWEPDKLEKELALGEARQAALVCSDLRMIDGDGNVLADSITELRPRHIFAEGPGLAGQLIYRNFVTGCTVLMPAAVARRAAPFAKSMVQDHYLAFYAALQGEIAVCPEPLVRYRQHGGNQTGVLQGIHSKDEYLVRHLGEFAARTEELSRRFGAARAEEAPAGQNGGAGQAEEASGFYRAARAELETARRWLAARRTNAAREPGGARQLWRLRQVNLSTSLFELIGLRLPEPLFRLALRWIRAGKI